MNDLNAALWNSGVGQATCRDGNKYVEYGGVQRWLSEEALRFALTHDGGECRV